MSYARSFGLGDATADLLVSFGWIKNDRVMGYPALEAKGYFVQSDGLVRGISSASIVGNVNKPEGGYVDQWGQTIGPLANLPDLSGRLLVQPALTAAAAQARGYVVQDNGDIVTPIIAGNPNYATPQVMGNINTRGILSLVQAWPVLDIASLKNYAANLASNNNPPFIVPYPGWMPPVQLLPPPPLPFYAPGVVPDTTTPSPVAVVVPVMAGPPAGWNRGTDNKGNAGWWGADGLFYVGATPWLNPTGGISFSSMTPPKQDTSPAVVSSSDAPPIPSSQPIQAPPSGFPQGGDPGMPFGLPASGDPGIPGPMLAGVTGAMPSWALPALAIGAALFFFGKKRS